MTVPEQKSQQDLFIETARAIGADKEEAVRAKLTVIARQKLKEASQPVDKEES